MGFVDDLLGLRPEGSLVARPVVGAELQVTTPGKHDANVGLRVATIATIGRTEDRSRQRRSHGTSRLCGADYPNPTSLTRSTRPDTRRQGLFATGEILHAHHHERHRRATRAGPTSMAAA